MCALYGEVPPCAPMVAHIDDIGRRGARRRDHAQRVHLACAKSHTGHGQREVRPKLRHLHSVVFIRGGSRTHNAMFLILALALCGLAAGEQLPPTPDVYSFEQSLSHFDKNETRTFAQRVLVYSKSYKKGGPVFFCPGGARVEKGREERGRKQRHTHTHSLTHTTHTFVSKGSPMSTVATRTMG
jgi:hypothetical protein